MSFADRFTLSLAAIFAYLAYQNAVEAHRHTHELACHVQADDLCRFHRADE